MIATQTDTNPWVEECELLRCIACGGHLEPAADRLTCAGCARAYPVRDQFLDMLGSLRGNNKVAADFYNGPLWPKFRFWEWFTFFCNGGERRSRNKIMQYLPDLAGTRLLEVAVGDGANIAYVPADCQVYGNDISVVQLRNCRRHFPERKLRLFLSEAETLPFRDHTFDNVLSVGAFNYFNDPLGALREMARVVKPGGGIVISDEYPNLPNRMIGYKLGMPWIDRWIMARFLHLGSEFTDMVDKHRNMKLEPIANEVLTDWQIHSLWRGMGYCIVGRPRA